ncbi:MAG TPA: tryptophan synthase subunit alpha [Candidatus Avacidaminococcus intestinavium]|uniref:Tryptophan synthase alpha chain n=1 Tax=Candidatus Avacidaminococcus intestinavium TaxID=2840684 RepID=A0A9D1MQM9_9FIRM|nr:tryptophan synthase subunit alpha [Candidatus Avacidaminococcus intestinavium]
MSKIEKAFKKNTKAFIPFITAGDPNLAITKDLILALAEAGSSIVEIGIPFSDPIAEGEVIQKANLRALASGTTTDKIFAMLGEVRKKTAIPIVFLTYVNPIFTYGTEKFFANCLYYGVDGVIVPDVPYEEKEELLSFADKYEVDLITLVAPTSAQRIQLLVKSATGYIYIVSSLGVTGVRKNITTDIDELVAKIKAVSDTPIAVGFGISTQEQAQQMAKASDGVIVGSALVKLMEVYGNECVPVIKKYAQSMVQAIQS